jgi:predicted DNA-binding protein
MMLKGAIEKKLIEFEDLAKEVKATRKGLNALETLEKEIGKLLNEYLKNAKDDKDFEFMANATNRIIEVKKSLYN